jgi:hypothetical protein
MEEGRRRKDERGRRKDEEGKWVRVPRWREEKGENFHFGCLQFSNIHFERQK